MCFVMLLLSVKSWSSGRLFHYAGHRFADECQNSDGCPTGDAIIMNGYRLLAKRVIHAVGPRYSVKYQTAAENALHGCYRRSLELLKDNQLHTIAFPLINTDRKGYPKIAAAHIAIRTLRKSLEKFGNGIDAIVLCMDNQADMDTYNVTAALFE